MTTPTADVMRPEVVVVVNASSLAASMMTTSPRATAPPDLFVRYAIVRRP